MLLRLIFRFIKVYDDQLAPLLLLVNLESKLTLLCLFESKWLTCERQEREKGDGFGYCNE